MFTGIINEIGTVLSVEEGQEDRRFVIQTAFDMTHIPVGASIACSGCCLTVVEKSRYSFAVDVSAETLSKTTLGAWKEGTQINLENSLKMGDAMGGHVVFGHVDGVATLESITPEGNSHRLTFSIPEEFAKFVAPKGSVGLDGISLTVNEVEGNTFGVNIIPHTWEATTMGNLRVGDQLNFEVDTVARYVSRYVEYMNAA